MDSKFSRRAFEFLNGCTRTNTSGGPTGRDEISVAPELAETAETTEEAIARMVFFDEHYGGRIIPVRGGVLAGLLTLGTGARPSVLRSTGGEPMFRIGRHNSAQCAIVMSGDGRIGCSWSFEFHPLFDSIEKFIEDCSAWNQIRGWQYVAIADAIPVDIVTAIDDLHPDEFASGEKVKWWTSSRIAITSHPYLNPARSSEQVAILAASEIESTRIREALERKGYGSQGALAASLRKVVE
ncbi:hypothetical protein [Kitasatospora griseola]|uniref:hypothetical protein n=1 Tax=Kitasatospora griseola TaxID=2064 RepID=UPI00128E0F09|nr:hypothetical protein [Kitasatospora griseola]